MGLLNDSSGEEVHVFPHREVGLSSEEVGYGCDKVGSLYKSRGDPGRGLKRGGGHS